MMGSGVRVTYPAPIPPKNSTRKSVFEPRSTESTDKRGASVASERPLEGDERSEESSAYRHHSTMHSRSIRTDQSCMSNKAGGLGVRVTYPVKTSSSRTIFKRLPTLLCASNSCLKGLSKWIEYLLRRPSFSLLRTAAASR